MNVPAIARKTFEELRHLVEFNSIINFVLNHLSKLSKANQRATFVHQLIDEYNVEVFNHSLVKQLSPCKKGCSACCHTQVSVTDDEAEVLVQKLNAGLKIDQELLDLQFKTGDDSSAFFNLKYTDRRCIFLDDSGSCQVYEHRPAVCRTNAVIGNAEQCDTSESVKPIRLVKTPKADMVIYAAFLHSKKSGSLPQMIKRKLIDVE
jgi:Fe-S-cluster containining protein